MQKHYGFILQGVVRPKIRNSGKNQDIESQKNHFSIRQGLAPP